MKENLRNLALFIRHVLDGDDVKSIPGFEKINKKEIMNDAVRTGTLSLVYPFFNDKFDKNDKYSRIEARIVSRNLRQKAAQKELMDRAEKTGLDIMLLKGSWIRDMYPNPDLRSMGDLDIYYDYSHDKEMRSIMEELGYKDSGERSHHSKWFSERTAVTVEMHHTFEAVEYYGHPFYKKALERKEKYGDFNHVYHLHMDDAYVYQMIHLYHHATRNNVSLKQLCDLYIYEKYGVNVSNLQNTLNSLSLLEFSNSTNRIIDYAFRGKEIEFNEMDVALSNVFFNVDDTNINDVMAMNEYREAGSLNKFIFRKIFPKKSQMYIAYPYLDRHRILLPFYYVKNLVYKLKTGEGKSFKSLKKAGYDNALLNLILKKY